MGHDRRAASPGATRTLSDGGTSIVELVVALVMLSIAVTAMVPMFVGVLRATAGLGAKQTAVTIASRQLEHVRSIAPEDLLTGRNSADVAALVAQPGLADLSRDVTTSGNSDPAASAGSAGAVVKLTETQTLNGTSYLTRTFINVCHLSKTTGSCEKVSSNGPPAFRISVAVSWPRTAEVACATGYDARCEHVTTTIVDTSPDPVFSVNAPPTISSLRRVVGGTEVALGTLHPRERVTVKLNGTSFVYGAGLFSSNGDVVGPVTPTGAGTGLTATLDVSTVPGNRTLVVANPDGTSASLGYPVATSAPTLAALSPSSFPDSTARTFTLTGTDFFAAAGSPPTVTLTGIGTRNGSSTTISPATSAVTVVSRTTLTFTATFPAFGSSYTATGTLRLTNPDGGTRAASYTLSVT